MLVMISLIQSGSFLPLLHRVADILPVDLDPQFCEFLGNGYDLPDLVLELVGAE